MPQTFKPAANTIASVSLFAGAAVPFLALVTGTTMTGSPYNTKQFVPIDQPVPFSHKHHALELGIDCRYCHTSVEDSAIAGVPSTDVCMSCHSQIWTNSPNLDPVRKSYETGTRIQWNKVNDVPDFVYFNHSIHIARGISCNNCHGAVNKMELTWKGSKFQMAWCLECHEKPSNYLYETEDLKEGKISPREQVFALYRKLSAGAGLTETERKLAEGLPQVVPKDEVHASVAAMKERGINVTQLKDCYVCHH
jgi:hypothetical protein